MPYSSYGWAAFCAAAFVLWPVVGKSSGASGAWVNVLILVWSTIAGIAFSTPSIMQQPWPTFRTIGIIGIAGLINGAAVYYYSMQTSHPLVPTGKFIATTTILMVVFGLLFATFLNETVSLRQCAGLVTAGLAIYLIAG